MPPPRTREHIENRLSRQGECLVWTGALTTKGYGHLVFHGRRWQLHRLVWTWHFGPISPGKLILHTCDNPACGNPEHLFMGTHQDNMDDMVRKGRAADQRGVKNGNARLTLQQVDEIRAAKGSQYAIAHQYGISQSMVSRIRRKENWS
jgi:hypothetical protein